MRFPSPPPDPHQGPARPILPRPLTVIGSRSPTTRKGRPAILSWHQWRLWLSGLLGSRYDGLRNFSVVEPGMLMRCGQPRVRDLEQVLRTHGLRAIFVARGGTRHPLRGRWFAKEQQFCQRHGIRLEHVPFSDRAPPPPEVFDRFLSVAGDPACRPLLVHCEQGYHRTGILCAAFRIGVQGWSVQEALEEMRHLGFELEGGRRRPLVDALRAWAAARAAARAGGAPYPTLVPGSELGASNPAASCHQRAGRL